LRLCKDSFSTHVLTVLDVPASNYLR